MIVFLSAKIRNDVSQVAYRFPLHPWYHYLYLFTITQNYACKKKRLSGPFFVISVNSISFLNGLIKKRNCFCFFGFLCNAKIQKCKLFSFVSFG